SVRIRSPDPHIKLLKLTANRFGHTLIVSACEPRFQKTTLTAGLFPFSTGRTPNGWFNHCA
ncbi:MAG: hypothetical protein WCC95_03425, partial [Candidatus Sulfotelmatobacter sp.]